MKRLFFLAVGLAVAATLSSCGGGGGGNPNPYAGDWKWIDGSDGRLHVDSSGSISGDKDTSGWGHVHVSGKIDKDGNWQFLVKEPGVSFWGHCETRNYTERYDLAYRGDTYWLTDGAGSPAPNATLDGLLAQLKQK